MDEFRNSSPDLERPEALKARVAEEGCLFFRGLLPADQVLATRELTLRALDEAGWLADGEPPANAKPGPKVVSEGDEDFFDAYRLIEAAEAFHALAHQEALTQLMGRLIDDEVLVHPRKIARIAFPNNPRGTTPPHQDFRYIQGTTDVFTVWIPLGECPPELGGLRVLRGSQDRGLLPVEWNTEKASGFEVDVADSEPDWATIDYQPGDAIVFHSLTVHGAIPNQAGQIRLSADYRYQAARDPLVRGSLRPHFFPRIPDWPELVADWTTLAPISVPGQPTTEDYLASFDLPPLRPSRYFTFAGQATAGG